MSNLVSLKRDGNVALITIDNPPVNALSSAVRAGILENFRTARDDAQVQAIVFMGAGRTFIAGADITEFGKPPQPPVLIDVIAEIDQSPKPTIAAMHGTPLGGGFEVTLACHFRVAAPSTRVGLPEIKLGLFPAAGGTQRLPRIVGMDKAAAMILSGEQVSAKEGVKIGLIDEIVEGDLAAGAIAFAKRVVAEKRALRRVSEMDDKIAPLRAEPAKFDEIMASQLKRGRVLDAAKAAIESMRQSLTLGVEEASRNDRDSFVRLIPGEQSRAQRHIFFAEREAGKVPGVTKDTRAKEIKRAAVIGAGTMGGGIAMCFANAGIPVTVVETNADALKRGLETVAKNYKTSVTRGSLTQDEMDRRVGLFSGVTDLEATKDADLVIEAVFEEMDIKKQIFGALDRITGPDTVLATNTSYLDVNAIAKQTERPPSVLGMHFFSPANVMRLLEIVRGDETSPEALATAMAVGR